MKLNGVTGAYGQALNGADIYIVMTVVMLGVSTLGVISFYAQMVLKAAGACTVIFDVIDAEVSVDPNDKGTKVEHGSLQGKYEFKKINFKYPTRPDLHILKDLDIVCEAGQTTAFVGPSGSGKSTIIQLCMRFYNPLNDGGEILLDGKPIKSYDLRSLR